jgi:hypothetical protein
MSSGGNRQPKKPELKCAMGLHKDEEKSRNLEGGKERSLRSSKMLGAA